MKYLLTIASLVGALSGASAFSVDKPKASSPTTTSANTRRSFLAGGAAALVAGTAAVAPVSAATETRQGIDVTAFNGLIFNYRNSDSNAGLDASTLDEPSVPFLEFGDKLQKGEVSFVEFMAPDGDAAYVTFKASETEPNPKPIRIGEGYPIEQHDGWSSPAFVVRAVKQNNVPYKFTVPALAKYKTT